MLSGRRLDLLDPSALDIEIEDIAHGLARVARWNGGGRSVGGDGEVGGAGRVSEVQRATELPKRVSAADAPLFGQPTTTVAGL